MPDCDVCEKTWALSGKEPKNCADCMPVVFESNKEAFEIFMIVRNQHIMAFGGPVDLNLTALDSVMDIMRVENKREVFDKVHYMYKISLKKIHEKIEAEQDKRK